jgi:hypothetical protein
MREYLYSFVVIILDFMCVLILCLHGLDADLTSGDLVSGTNSALESLQLWVSELLASADSSHPEGETVGKELASASGASALNEWSGSEVFKARAWAKEVLSATVGTFAGVSEEGVTHPHGVVSGWAVWDLSGLRVDGNDGRWSFAYVTSGDVWSDRLGLNGHSWDWLGSSQPVALGVSAGVSADLVDTAEGGWHSAKLLGARTGGTEILSMMVVVTDSVQETVTVPEGNGASWAAWVLSGLTVSSENDADSGSVAWATWGAWLTVETVGTWDAGEAWLTSWTLLAAFTGWAGWTGWAGDAVWTGWTLWTGWTVDTVGTSWTAWTWWAVWTAWAGFAAWVRFLSAWT